MPITNLSEVYDVISKYPYQLSPDQVSDLRALLQESLSDQDQALLLEKEKPLNKGCSMRMLDRCVLWLEERAALASFDAVDYDNAVEVFNSLIRVLPFDYLNKPHHLHLGLVKNNVFNLAFNHLALLCQKFHETKQRHYHELASKWCDEVCLPIIEKGFDLDVGIEIFGNTVIFRCCKLITGASAESDPMMRLLQKILEKTTQINRRNGLKMTPLSVALKRELPYEVLTLLIKHGASVNVQAKYKELHGGVLIPLLSFCIKDKNYKALQFLLDQGADPNVMPEKEIIYFSDNRKNEMLLTPYQLAVAMNDATAIEIILQHAKRKGIALVACSIDSVPGRYQALSDSSVKVRGAKLALVSKHCLFQAPDNLVHELFDELGVRCYVAPGADRKNIVESLRWLYGQALESAMSAIWRPIHDCLREKMCSGDLAIYVGNIPAEISAHGLDCQGMFAEGNIYVLPGLSVKRYTQVIAHEAAHLFDAEHISLRKGHQTSEHAKAFMAALNADLESQPDSSMSFYVKEVRSLYADHGIPEKEFFAYLFMDQLFQYVGTESNPLDRFKRQLPKTYAWYEQSFMVEVHQPIPKLA